MLVYCCRTASNTQPMVRWRHCSFYAISAQGITANRILTSDPTTSSSVRLCSAREDIVAKLPNKKEEWSLKDKAQKVVCLHGLPSEVHLPTDKQHKSTAAFTLAKQMERLL